VEPVGGMSKIQFLRGSDKVFEVSKFHYRPRSVGPILGQHFIRTR